MALTKAHKNNVRLALATGATFAMLMGAQALITLDAAAQPPVTPDVVIATDVLPTATAKPTVTAILPSATTQSKIVVTAQPASVQGKPVTTTPIPTIPVVTAVPVKPTATKPAAVQIKPTVAQPQPVTRASKKR